MFAKPLTILLCLFPFTANAQDRAPFGPPGYELPDKVTKENMFEIATRMRLADCRLPGCVALGLAIAEVDTDPNQRHNPGTIWNGPAPNIPYGAIKAREIDKSLRPYRAMWPAICRAVTEIGARDDFVNGIKNYRWIASAALDVARHLTRPGLDCLGQTLAAMPQSKYLQYSMSGAWRYCLDEGRGAARCARLKPTDPDFLPALPLVLSPR